VADVEAAFSLTDLTIQPSGLPLNVQRACEWTRMCSVSDIHANSEGYAVIARAYAEELAP
jgi:lysophospholipase L1-like esterase